MFCRINIKCSYSSLTLIVIHSLLMLRFNLSDGLRAEGSALKTGLTELVYCLLFSRAVVHVFHYIINETSSAALN